MPRGGPDPAHCPGAAGALLTVCRGLLGDIGTRAVGFGWESSGPVDRQAAQRSGPAPGPPGATQHRGRPRWERPGSDLDAAPALVLQEVHGRHDAGLEGEAQEEVELRRVQLLLHGQDLRAWAASPAPGGVTGQCSRPPPLWAGADRGHLSPWFHF